MTFEEEMKSALENFMLEVGELLSDMETGLLALEQDSSDQESVNSVFRAAHTVKGSAGLFGLDPVVRFTHVVESVLDRVRDQEISATAALIGVLLPCKDHIGELITDIAGGGSGESAAQEATGAALLAQLQPYLHDSPMDSATPTEPDDRPDASALLKPDPEIPSERLFHLSLRFGPESLRNGMDRSRSCATCPPWATLSP